MSRRIMSAAVIFVGASLVWGGSTLLGQTVTPKQAPGAGATTATVAAAGSVPVIAATSSGETLNFVPFDASVGVSSPGVIVPGAPGVDSGSVAAIPLPPSAYPGMVGLATAAYAGWRYRRRRR